MKIKNGLRLTNRKGPPVSIDVLTIDDQIRGSEYHNDSVTLKNDKSAKAKLVKGSKRIPFKVKEKSTSCTLIFCVGAWLTAVLPAGRYWNEIKGSKTCKVGEINIKGRKGC